MRFNNFVKYVLPSDIICILSEITRSEVIARGQAARKWINSRYSDRIIDRVAIIPRDDGIKGGMIAVTFKPAECTAQVAK